VRAQAAVPEPLSTTSAKVPSLSGLPKRRCGRCQCEFDADPNLFFQTDWALCPPCGDILLPSSQATPPVGPLPRGR
jgi:hypothetical protein